MSVPILDFTALEADSLSRACEDWGFFALVNHGVPGNLQARASAHMAAFFAQPTAVKNTLRRSERNSWGYNDAELTKNKRDWKEILDIGAPADSGPLAGSFPQWPELAGFKDTFEAIADEYHRVALGVAAAIARCIDPYAKVSGAFDEHSSFLRLNYYPPCATPARQASGLVADDGHLGISHHTDAGAVTVLWQDPQPGLQVYKDNRWHTVTPVAESLIINVGDIVQVWSNDRFRAPLHRVLANSEAQRYSLPYFLNPAYDYDYKPLREDEAPRYRPINWGAFRAGRSAGDYADYGAEIQISDFLIA